VINIIRVGGNTTYTPPLPPPAAGEKRRLPIFLYGANNPYFRLISAKYLPEIEAGKKFIQDDKSIGTISDP
jgi:hypothetical protein